MHVISTVAETGMTFINVQHKLALTVLPYVTVVIVLLIQCLHACIGYLHAIVATKMPVHLIRLLVHTVPRLYIFIFFAGLSPDLQSMEQIRRIMRPTDVPDTG